MKNTEISNIVESMDLKLLARISKAQLKRIIRQVKVYSLTEPYSIPSCISCDYHNSHCKNKSQCIRENEIVYAKYITENRDINTFNIKTNRKTSFSLSKSAIKQFILYHFLPEDKDLLRKGVTYTKIAKLCGVTPATAKNNQKLLEEVGLAYTKKSFVAKNKFDIMIKDEFRIHESKEENKKAQGYLTLSQDILKELLNIDNVSTLKTDIQKLLHTDYKTSKVGEHVSLNKDNLTEMLPQYITKWKKKCLEIISSTKSLLPLKGNELDISKYLDSKKQMESLQKDIAIEVNDVFRFKQCPYSSEYGEILGRLEYLNETEIYAGFKKEYQDKLSGIQIHVMMDIASLAIQYGKRKVFTALEQMIHNHSKIDEQSGQVKFNIKSPGAYIRSAIRSSLSTKGCLI